MTTPKNNICIATSARHYTFQFCILFVVALLLVFGSVTTTASAFSQLQYSAVVVTATASSRRTTTRTRINAKAVSRSVQVQEQQQLQSSLFLSIRGGEQQQQEANPLCQEQNEMSQQDQQQQEQASSPQIASLNVFAFLAPLGTSYKAALDASPILTKSATACLIFGLSDYLAQLIENKSNNKSSKEQVSDMKNKKKNTILSSSISSSIVWKRTLMSAAVGFFYFGPAAHAWYDMIFRIFPGTSLVSTLQKAALGQIFFGPSFMCIFFASTLLQSGRFSLSNWWMKIRRDLWGAWLAGIAFWPMVDVISYSVVPVVYIPLFVNMCSLVWTIYLSNISNRSTNNNTDQTAKSSPSS